MARMRALLSRLPHLGVALALAWPCAAHSARQRIACPDVFPAGVLRGDVPPGWRVVGAQDAAGTRALLSDAGMLHGAPEEGGYLAPAWSRASGQGVHRNWTQQWHFEQPHWYPTFVVCGYGGNPARVQLFHPIDRTAKACTATRSGAGDGGVKASFVCR